MFCLRTLRELKLLKFLSEAGVSENVCPSLFMPVTCNPGLGPSRRRAELPVGGPKRDFEVAKDSQSPVYALKSLA